MKININIINKYDYKYIPINTFIKETTFLPWKQNPDKAGISAWMIRPP